MLFLKLYKIMVNKVTFVGFKGGDRPNHPPLDPPLRQSKCMVGRTAANQGIGRALYKFFLQ